MAANDSGEPDTKKPRVDVSEGDLCGIGNPLLDISANADETFLKKYDLEANNAILTEDKHIPMFKDMIDNLEVEYIPGGATQNTFRVVQWVLNKPKVCTFFGCIGEDDYGKKLSEGMASAGCNARYQINKEVSTGTCACVITSGGKNRSLAANLAAANHFNESHFEDKENWDLVVKGKLFYSAGFHLTVSPDSMLRLAKHAAENNKIYCTNLSAPFLCQFFSEPMMKLMPYVDFLFGNETRTVVFTQGDQATIVVKDGQVTEYPILPIKADQIVDTNGAGDAFVGGFLAQLVQDQDIARCVACGHYAASYIIQQSGTTMKDKSDFK
nr:uncharacterized protein LOC129281555 [Lytechinus pictus]